MILPVRLLPEARVEFNESTNWYEDQRSGLGVEFVAQIRKVIDRITIDPLQHAAIFFDIRKAIVRKFPFVVLYRIKSSEIIIGSVFHTSINPSVWK